MNTTFKISLGMILGGALVLFLLHIFGYKFEKNFLNFTNIDDKNFDIKQMQEYKIPANIDFNQIKHINIDTKSVVLKLQNSSNFGVKTGGFTSEELQNLQIVQENAELKIQTLNEDGHFDMSFIKSFKGKKTKSMIIYLPENLNLNKFNLKSAGIFEAKLSYLNIDDFVIATGFMKLDVQNLNVNNKFKIDAGVVDLNLAKVQVNNLKLSSGVSDIQIQGDLYGENSLDTGVSDIKLNLARSAEGYYIKKDYALGTSSDTERNANAKDKIYINAGISDIDIEFAQ